MSTHDARVSALADAIERYLQAHPQAADSPEGVQSWWLPAPLSREPLAIVVAALEELERRGVVEKTALERGHVFFRKAKS